MPAEISAGDSTCVIHPIHGVSLIFSNKVSRSSSLRVFESAMSALTRKPTSKSNCLKLLRLLQGRKADAIHHGACVSHATPMLSPRTGPRPASSTPKQQSMSFKASGTSGAMVSLDVSLAHTHACFDVLRSVAWDAIVRSISSRISAST